MRELAHALQLELMKSARKRMERHVPKIVASWLAGTFDRDRVVSRVATEGLSSFLTTPEKVTLFWRKCQPQILEYASDAILETAETLSDERSTSKDDAEAKYYRVVGGCLALFVNLMQKAETADLEKHRESYDKFLEVEKVWTSALADDSAVRRLSSQLVSVCLLKRPDAIEDNLARFSKIYISEGLKSSQTGSALDFINTLRALTAKYPTIWTSDYHGKKNPASRLRIFLEKGSQGSAATFWESLGQLFEALPSGVIPTDGKGPADFMHAMRSGVAGREEPRSNALNAWSCYLGLARSLMGGLPSGEEAVNFVQENLFPLTEQYLLPLPERSVWNSGAQIPVLIKAYTSAALSSRVEVVDATRAEWDRIKTELSTRMRNSLPEASKEHERSQKAIADEGGRWFALSGKILEGHKLTVGTARPIPDIPLQPSLDLILEAFELLQNRNWKPFGAAATIEAAMKHCNLLFQSKLTNVDDVLGQLKQAIPESGDVLLCSPSAQYIVSSINSLGQIPGREGDFEQIWISSTETILSLTENPQIMPALAKLLSSKPAASVARAMPQLQQELLRVSVECALTPTDAKWNVFNAAMSFDAFDDATGYRLAEELAALLTKQPGAGVIKSLLTIAQNKPAILSHDEGTHMSLMTSLLGLSERDNTPAEVSTLKTLLSHPSSGKSIIQQNLNDVNPSSLG